MMTMAAVAADQSAQVIPEVGGIHLRLSTRGKDPEWDAFLRHTPGGSHLQCSGWAESKAALGWKAARVVASRDGEILGGAQMLVRGLGPLAAVGHVARGPVVATTDPQLVDGVLAGLNDLAHHLRVRYLLVQPPHGGESQVPVLEGRGFSPGAFLPHPPCTVIVDLRSDEDEILARMRPSMRRNVRLAVRRGISVIQGGAADLPTFHRLLTLTGGRQGFAAPSLQYFRTLWESMVPDEGVMLLLAVREGEPVSAGLYIRFGDTLTYKRGGWSGAHGGDHPNELMHWEAMRWGRAHGCRYFDVDGISEGIARRVESGQPLTDEDRQTVTHFKLGLGGEITWSPGSYDVVLNPVLRRVCAVGRTAFQRLGLAHRLESLARRR